MNTGMQHRYASPADVVPIATCGICGTEIYTEEVEALEVEIHCRVWCHSACIAPPTKPCGNCGEPMLVTAKGDCAACQAEFEDGAENRFVSYFERLVE